MFFALLVAVYSHNPTHGEGLPIFEMKQDSTNMNSRTSLKDGTVRLAGTSATDDDISSRDIRGAKSSNGHATGDSHLQACDGDQVRNEKTNRCVDPPWDPGKFNCATEANNGHCPNGANRDPDRDGADEICCVSCGETNCSTVGPAENRPCCAAIRCEGFPVHDGHDINLEFARVAITDNANTTAAIYFKSEAGVPSDPQKKYQVLYTNDRWQIYHDDVDTGCCTGGDVEEYVFRQSATTTTANCPTLSNRQYWEDSDNTDASGGSCVCI
jgi:hypothetical protein